MDLEDNETLRRLRQSSQERVLDREAREKIVETYAKTEEFDRMVNSIKIDQEMLRERVIEKLADKIIKSWREDG